MSGERIFSVKLDIYLKQGTSRNEAIFLVKNIADIISSHGMVISSVAKYNPTVKTDFGLFPVKLSFVIIYCRENIIFQVTEKPSLILHGLKT